MDLTTSWRGRILVASLRGELDMKHHENLAAALDELAGADTTGLVLNFADVIYLASVGIGMLLKLVQKGKDRGIAVRLAAPRPAVRMILEMVRAESSLPMDATIEEAIEHLAPVAA